MKQALGAVHEALVTATAAKPLDAAEVLRRLKCACAAIVSVRSL
jgi:hypothetical protein